jgi:glycosyltransferase involved in cell wall biosynthesis
MSTKKPPISILTPVWNGLPYIKECIDSVFSQDYSDWELIISDNGSTDGTRDYLETLNDPRVQIFKQEKNLGIDGNLNFLLSKASFPIIYYLCADDYFYPGALKKVMDAWSHAAPETALIGFNWKEVLKHSELANFSYRVLPKQLDPLKASFAFFLFGNLPGNLSNVSARLDILKAAGGFDEWFRQAGDFEFWSRIAKDHPIVLSDTETSFVRRHAGVATKYMNSRGTQFAEHLAIYEPLINHLSPYVDRKKLLTYFNIEIASYHLRDAIKYAFHGRFARSKSFMDTRSSICWPKWKQVTLCLPFALYEGGRSKFIIKMAREIMSQAEARKKTVNKDAGNAS